MSENTTEKKSHGFLKFIIAVLIIGACVFGIVKFIQYEQSQAVVDGNGTTQGNTDGNTHLFKRSANNNDIVVDADLDLTSFGVKCVIMPQTDIEGLVVRVNFLDKNKNIIDSVTKNLGNVTKGVQVSFSISLFDLGLSVAWNTNYESVAVIGGTVSYFA